MAAVMGRQGTVIYVHSENKARSVTRLFSGLPGGL